MSAVTQAFLALDRAAVLKLLSTTVKEMDDATLKTASYLLISRNKPSLLESLAPPVNEIVHEEHDMREASEENIKRLMKLKGIDDIAAWTELRCLELEDGASICCSEECSDREEADEDLVAAARRGKKKRLARRGHAVSDDEEEDSAKAPYVAPPKVRDAELNWPFMRCKNVVNALQRSQTRWIYGNPPKNHHGLLEYIAKVANVSVETLKSTSPRDIFKDNYYVMQVLGKSSRW
jgi:hypothetical protein